MNNYKVSIITPVYNTPREYLEKCFESVNNQSYNNIEFIIIDDGSEKNTADFCDSFWKDKWHYIDVKVIHNKNHGVSFSRNCALDMATGDYVAFLDSDDAIAYNYIESLVSAVRLLKCKVAVCDYSREGIENPEVNISDAVLYKGSEIWHNLNTSYIWRTIYSSDIVKDIRFDENLKCCEDIDFFDRVIKKARKIGYLPAELYFYRQTAGSISHKFSPDICRDAFTTYERIYLRNKYIKYNKNVYSDVFSYYSRWIIRYIIAISYTGDMRKFDRARKMLLKKTRNKLNLINNKKSRVMASLAVMPSCLYYILIRIYDAMRIVKVKKEGIQWN